jgi:mannose-6-phosphate isomerase-like protein (cupin superfamily)
VEEIYILISPQPGQAEIEITAGGEKYELRSPGVFRVPAGVVHCFETTAAVPGSFLLGILHRRNG